MSQATAGGVPAKDRAAQTSLTYHWGKMLFDEIRALHATTNERIMGDSQFCLFDEPQRPLYDLSQFLENSEVSL